LKRSQPGLSEEAEATRIVRSFMGKIVLTAVLLGLSATLVAPEPLRAQEPERPGPPEADATGGGAGEAAPAQAVARLVDQIRKQPAQPSKAADRLALHLIDAETGEVTLIADEPDPGLVRCGSPAWSHDGRRIVFDAMPMNQVPATHLKVIELIGGRPVVSDLGPGNCPTWSPSDDRIAFLNNSRTDGAELGVWLMQADGSGRRALGAYGRPLWSPDSRQFLIVDFGNPRAVTIMDVRPEKSGPLQLPGTGIAAEPSWAGEGLIIAAIGPGDADSIALIDVSDPARGMIKEVLWKRGKGPDVTPSYPLYSARTRRCVFIGPGPKGRALYAFERGKSGPPMRLEPEGFDRVLQDLAYSPDGRYVLFSSDRPAPRRRDAARGGDPGAGGGRSGDTAKGP
jgi:Tol biopolymer transport system component